MENKKSKKISVFAWVVGTILIIYSFCLLFLFLWGVVASMKDAATFKKMAILPEFPPDFSNFSLMYECFTIPKKDNPFMGDDLFAQFLYSIMYAGGGAFFQTLCTAMVAYCTAKYKGWFSSFVNTLVIVTIALPIVGNMPSMIEVLQELELFDTLIGMWIMKFGFINVYYFIFYAAFQGIAWDYAEAAFLDGASHFKVFVKIMLPMVMTLCGTIFLMFFISYWNDYQTPMVYWESHPTVAYGLQRFLFQVSNPIGVQMEVALASNIPVKIAAGVIVAIPMIVVFIIFRNKLMGNLSEGGIKA